MGQWHGIAHASHGHQASTAHDFGHDADDDASCRLYDQLGHADALCAALPRLAEPAPTALRQPADERQAPGRTLRPYQARAPPRG